MAIPTPSACSAIARLLLAGLLASAAGCGEGETGSSPPRHDGPIVLITVEGLRPDAMGAFGATPSATPNLDRLAASATWAGRAIAPSSWVLPSAATLLTGVRPWEHRAISSLERTLEPRFVTLAEALGELGYRSRAYVSCSELRPAYGFGQGFESVLAMRRGARASADLRALGGGRELFWVHLELPAPPYVRRDALAAVLPPPPPDLPRRVGGVEREVYFDPQTPLPSARREQLWALYRYNVAAADAMIGRLLAELDASGQREETLLVVTSLFGQELGEHGQIGQGGNLGRALIEVPLLISLPRTLARPLLPPPSERVASARLWATLVEAAGGQAPPGVAASLFRPAPREVLSELYMVAGHNELSLVDGDEQLRSVVRFADPGDDFFAQRLAAIGAGRDGAERHVFRQRLEELDRRFRAASPLTGDGSPPRLLHERWTAGGVERVEDPARAAALARRLEVAFNRFAEPPP